jgi:ABC-type uncharacterized transport system ATPase subunit
MINKGTKVLDGPINEIRQQFGKNALRLEFSGNGKDLQHVEAVKSVAEYSNYAEIELNDGFTANDLLKEILPSFEIHNFTSKQSSLNDIFLQLAGGTKNE